MAKVTARLSAARAIFKAIRPFVFLIDETEVRRRIIEVLGTHDPAKAVAAAASAYLTARDEFKAWHDENPGASGGRFSREFFKVANAEDALRAAISAAERS